MTKDIIIRKLKGLSEKNISSYNEANVKQHIISELLRIFDLHHIAVLEYHENSDRPDYIIKDNNEKTNCIVIEAKGANEVLSKHIGQIKRYSYNFDALLTILTNGQEFLFFSPYWKRDCFENRLIFCFTLKDLSNLDVVEKLVSIFSFKSGSELEQTLTNFEYEVKEFESNILGYEKRLNILKSEKIAIKQNEPEIDELLKFINRLDDNTKLEIEKYVKIVDEITQIEIKLKEFRNAKPFFKKGFTTLTSEISAAIATNTVIPKREQGDFTKGYSDEVININAIIEGKQFVLCKSKELSNKRIFLVHKSTLKTDFVPSIHAKPYNHFPEQRDVCKHIAELEFIEIPGKSKKFWDKMFQNTEFDLWEIETGPWLYFTRRKKENSRMYFWIIRAYELSEELYLTKGIDNDYKSGAMDNYDLINVNKLNEIQDGFVNQKFKSVIDDEEFKRRKKIIIDALTD